LAQLSIQKPESIKRLISDDSRKPQRNSRQDANMMPSSNDYPSSHYESKLAAAGYYHSEVLENVQGFDHNGSDGSLLDEKAGQ
jgi:hypothetical protein